MPTQEKYEATVGIFMPAYNQGCFIDEAINSLKKQTFQDFVVHIVDDGSDDGETPQKLKSIQYEKAKLFLENNNLGVAVRSKQHFKLLNTKYILVFCADDVLEPEFLEKTVTFLEKNKDFGAVSTNIKIFKKNINESFAEHRYNADNMTLPKVLARNQILGSSLIRKKALNETDLSGNFVRYRDWDRWISMLDAGWKIGLVDEFLFNYRQLDSSLSHTATVEDEMKIREELLKKHKKSYEKYCVGVLLEMERAFLEMKEAKDWLDGQYHTLNAEIDRLNGVITRLDQENAQKNEIIEELSKKKPSFVSRIKRRIKK